MTCGTSLNQLDILKTRIDKSAFLSVAYTVEPRFNHPLYNKVLRIILLHEKFLQFYWFRAVVFQLNLKYVHVKITNLLWVVV